MPFPFDLCAEVRSSLRCFVDALGGGASWAFGEKVWGGCGVEGAAEEGQSGGELAGVFPACGGLACEEGDLVYQIVAGGAGIERQVVCREDAGDRGCGADGEGDIRQGAGAGDAVGVDCAGHVER
jgi:hypothetical protein